MDIVTVSGYEGEDIRVAIHLVHGLGKGTHGLHQTDCKGIHPLGILGDIGDGMGHLEIEPEQVPDFFEQRNDLAVKIDAELKRVLHAVARDLKNTA